MDLWQSHSRGEASVIIERTFVGLDVHARSVVACGIDTVTGEVSRARLTPDNEELWSSLAGLDGPVAVAYEAGPTGFGLARFLTGRQLRCVVAAPSKITREPSDRVKTDARSAMLLTRRLKLDDLTAVVWSSDIDDVTPLGDVGDPATAIIEAAHAHAVDVVVIASHGRSWFSRLLSGSVEHDLLREADFAILVLK